ncbi:MAG TPA: universal stress protein [Alphaproteobacteria bacterium]|nr:universal stress protein [Alphaproteobacteria bacterium]
MARAKSKDDSGADNAKPDDGKPAADRIFLVVVDESEEMGVALRFACQRAVATGGRVALFYVVEPADFGHWMAVEDLMEKERRMVAEETLTKYSDIVTAFTGELPVLLIREGNRRDALLQLLEDEPGISILVLASGVGKGGPGPLIQALTGKFYKRLRVPMTIVPGNLSDEEVDALT